VVSDQAQGILSFFSKTHVIRELACRPGMLAALGMKIANGGEQTCATSLSLLSGSRIFALRRFPKLHPSKSRTLRFGRTDGARCSPGVYFRDRSCI